jgi:hypothetical protein
MSNFCEKCNKEKTRVFQKGQETSDFICVDCGIIPGICPFCGSKLRSVQARQCPNCYRSWQANQKPQDLSLPKPPSENTNDENTNDDELIRCSKCNSTQLTSNKRGFNFKKAAGGLLIPGGVLWGFHGRNKIVITCLKCGHKWKPGKL